MMSKKTLTIFRTRSNDDGTFGFLVNQSEGNQSMCYGYTAEPPWRDNQRSISCIPPGEYEVEITNSPRYGRVYHIKNVDNRSEILIHVGNYAGDVNLGKKSDSEGCIMLGMSLGNLNNKNGDPQEVVLSSGGTIKKFMAIMGDRPFTLSVVKAY